MSDAGHKIMRELQEARKAAVALGSALRDLHDEQNGPPFAGREHARVRREVRHE